jgi:hypothetical protein
VLGTADGAVVRSFTPGPTERGYVDPSFLGGMPAKITRVLVSPFQELGFIIVGACCPIAVQADKTLNHGWSTAVRILMTTP